MTMLNSWRTTASWNPIDRFWLAWPKQTRRKDEDDARRDDSVALAQLLSRYAPVSAVAGHADVAECSLHMPAGVGTLGADLGGAVLADRPLWLAGLDGALVAGIADQADGTRRWAAAAGLAVVDLPPHWRSDVIESDGQGTALVLNRLAEDMDGGRVAAERMLENMMGISRVVWLDDPGGGRLPARFLAPGIVAAPMGRVDHPAYAALSANRDRLRASSDRSGRVFDVVDLPCPERAAGCYSDLIVAGDLVVAPEYEDPHDQEAYDRIVAAVPDKRVIGFPATYLGSGGGFGRAVMPQPCIGKNN